MSDAVTADTHTINWYLREPHRLSKAAFDALRQAATSGDGIYLSAISIVEVIYLVDKGRLPEAALDLLNAAIDAMDTSLVVVPIDTAVARRIAQIPRDDVPDMPDRIIAATALHLNLPLVTRDARIRAASVPTTW